MRTTPDSEVRAGERVTWVGAAANLALIAAKIAAGVFGQSQALIADAMHSVSDFVSDAVALLGLRIGRKAPDADHHFGHGRVETLASAAVGVTLVLVAVYLGYDAGLAIVHRHEGLPNAWALFGALLSVAVKEALYHYTMRVGRRLKSPVLQANAWHHRSDALSSAAVIVGVAAALVNPEWAILDAFAALVVSVLIGAVGFGVLWKTLQEMVDAAPRPEVVEGMRASAGDTPGVQGVHDLRVRVVGGLYHVQVHVVVDRDATVVQGHLIANDVSARIGAAFDETGDVIVHVDPSPE